MCSVVSKGVAGFKVAPSLRPVREKVRPARPGVGVSAKKFALHDQNMRKTVFSAALGKLFRGRIAEGPHCERVYVRPQSLRRPLISRGQISHAIPLKVSYELEPLRFCRFVPSCRWALRELHATFGGRVRFALIAGLVTVCGRKGRR